jgi:hypothetical protein
VASSFHTNHCVLLLFISNIAAQCPEIMNSYIIVSCTEVKEMKVISYFPTLNCSSNPLNYEVTGIVLQNVLEVQSFLDILQKLVESMSQDIKRRHEKFTDVRQVFGMLCKFHVFNN